jgi:adenosylcobyric acid synthase
MALNSFATPDGREVGRAQAMQAEAAGIDVTVDMNPVLLKPEADSFSQVVVLGEPWARISARNYFRRRGELWSIVTGALDRLRAAYELVIIEGAGSPVELNLKQGEMVNMAIASHADAPVLLVGDIDRGGIFAQLLGTLLLLEEQERARVRGLVVNKFRGDGSLFAEGVEILQQRGGVPVLGVVPYMRSVGLADEDSVALDDRQPASGEAAESSLDIAVIRLPRISNFDDFDPLGIEPDVSVRFVERASDLGTPDMVILPGTKTTIDDLMYLRRCGLATRIMALAQAGLPVLGICGGYQMLGSAIRDPFGSESDVPEVAGLGLLPVVTHFSPAKQTVRAAGHITADSGLFAGAGGLPCVGYEIHMGQTSLSESAAPLLHISRRRDEPTDASDGAVAADGWIAGTYMHGFFDNDALRHAILSNLAARRGRYKARPAIHFGRELAYDKLAATVRDSLDMQHLYQMVNEQ